MRERKYAGWQDAVRRTLTAQLMIARRILRCKSTSHDRSMSSKSEVLIQQLRVLVVDDNPFMRNLVRSLLANIGVKTDLRSRRRHRRARDDPHRSARRHHPRLGDAAAQRPRTGAHRALARRIPDAGHPHHHAHRPWRALARSRIGQARRERISLQAGVGQGAVRPSDLDPAQAARERAARRILRPGAARCRRAARSSPTASADPPDANPPSSNCPVERAARAR